jgi:beta-lactam-binding protein with PASTA domain
MSLVDAQRRLAEAGLHIGDIQATGTTLRVTGTRPAPGEPVATGSAVTLVVEIVPPPPAEEAASRGR